MARRRDQSEDQLAVLRGLAADPHAAGARGALAGILKTGVAYVVVRAARLVAEHRVEGLEGELAAAWDRLDRHGVRDDKGCEARLALAEALDQLDHLDPEPFLRGVATFQREPDFPRPRETAGGLRGRCGMALVRMNWPDAILYLADLLADESPRAREGAARALGHLGGSGAQALLRYKLHLGDDEPDVDGAVMVGLLALDPEAGVALLTPLLAPSTGRAGGADLRRELAAFALGESRHDAAVPALVDLLDRSVLAADRSLALTALAVHRTDRSRQVLLSRIAHGTEEVARAVVKALKVQRFDPQTERLAREAAAANPDADLGALLDEVFSG